MRIRGLDRLRRYARILSARDTPRFACGTALALPAENVPPAHFLNAETFPGSNPIKFLAKSKIADNATLSDLVRGADKRT